MRNNMVINYSTQQCLPKNKVTNDSLDNAINTVPRLKEVNNSIFRPERAVRTTKSSSCSSAKPHIIVNLQNRLNKVRRLNPNHLSKSINVTLLPSSPLNSNTLSANVRSVFANQPSSPSKTIRVD